MGHKNTQHVRTLLIQAPTYDLQLGCKVQWFYLTFCVHRHGIHGAVSICEQLWGVVGVDQSDAGLSLCGVECAVVDNKEHKSLVVVTWEELSVMRVPACVRGRSNNDDNNNNNNNNSHY